MFGGFARLAFGDGRPVFDPVVYYLPGNHDHHLWETTRESQYVAYVCALPPDAELTAPWHTTKLEPAAESPAARSALLTGLIQRQPGCDGVDVRVFYPNLALRTPDADRCVVVTHGHFTESIYTLMSQLKDILYPGQRGTGSGDIDILEEENFAWIDFLWSTLGRSGQVGSDLGLIYADMTSPADLDALVANLTTAMLSKGKGPRWLHPAEHWALNAIFKREVNRLARTERGTPTVALTPQGQAGLRSYLEGPVRDQLQRELGRIPQEVSFVYGHTHKPFVDRWCGGRLSRARAHLQHRRLGGGHGHACAGPSRRGGARQRRPGGGPAAVVPSGHSHAQPGPAPAARGRRAAIGLARRAGIADRPGGGAVGVAVGVRGATDRPAPPAPSRHRRRPQSPAARTDRSGLRRLDAATRPGAPRAAILDQFLNDCRGELLNCGIDRAPRGLRGPRT